MREVNIWWNMVDVNVVAKKTKGTSTRTR
jgi:hypothetical protein